MGDSAFRQKQTALPQQAFPDVQKIQLNTVSRQVFSSAVEQALVCIHTSKPVV